MYATLEESPGLVAARRLAQQVSGVDTTSGDRYPVLIEQVCAEAGLWSPDVAARALAQSGGDTVRAVGLLRVWAAALPRTPAFDVAPADVQLVRRLSAAYAEVPGGQWLGPAPELASRLLDWADGPVQPAEQGDEVPDAGSAPVTHSTPGPRPPTRAECPRVRDLFSDAVVVPAPEDGAGQDPATAPLGHAIDRATRSGVLARGETASLVSLAALVLGRRREAVLAEVTAGHAGLRIPHPRTGRPCAVVEVPITEAEAVVDAEVDGQPALAIGWGVSLTTIERRAIAIALLDGALQADTEASGGLAVDDQTVVAATDGSATNGFVEHLRLPHHASFASYLDQARSRGTTP